MLHYAAAALYVLTVNVGLVGNVWVVSSVLRSRKPKNNMAHTSPSDRLRMYIACLATVDLTVLMALLVRTLYLLMPELRLDGMGCQAVFLLEHSVKFASLTCLACISIERYVTIRKPFSSRVRKRFIQFIPLAGILALASILVAMFIQTQSVAVTGDSLNCEWKTERSTPRVAAFAVALAFMILLAVISVNYSQIVRHVRRKFVKRKQRVVAHSRANESQVNEPRYMREMTNAIIRVGVFHVVCWLPFCILQFLPLPSVTASLLSSLRYFENFTNFSILQWILFISNWLTYANAAGDWIFYAALNRDLRNLIRLTTERRKRSTLSQQCSPSNLHRSLRQQVTSSLRFFQSMHSYRSSAGCSFDDSMCAPSLPAFPATSTPRSSPKSSVFSHDPTTINTHSPRFFGLKKQSASLLADEVLV